MLVGEAPGETEERLGVPFVGQSGQELDRMLKEAGIMRSECFATNVVRVRPPGNKIEHFIPEKKKDITPDCIPLLGRMVKPIVVEGYNQLLKEISLVRPNVIVALGNVPMWALTGKWGITTWRGSLLSTSIGPTKVLPTYHPAAILRVWDWRFIAVHDLRRANNEARSPDIPVEVQNFIVHPSYRECLYILDRLKEQLPLGRFELAVDIETSHGLMTCMGLAWSGEDAITIPFTTSNGNYFSFEEELEIVWKVIEILTHPNVFIIGQNFLYDAQYIAKEWGILLPPQWDTMVQHHVLFAGLPKNLGFLSSLYLDNHVQWKTDTEDIAYNPKDCVKTFSIAQVERNSLIQMALDGPSAFQQRLLPAVLNIMLFGMKVSAEARVNLGKQFEDAILERQEFIKYVLQHEFNPRSPQQMQRLFYDDLRLPIQWNRKNNPPTPTCDDDALNRLSEKEPLVAPLCSVIGDIRSFNVFLKTFVQSPLDSDGRMRGTLNPAGTESYRFSSSENAFGNGMNMENIPSDKSMSMIKFLQRLKSSPFPDFRLPNVRELFIPDTGMLIFDADLDRADLQVVVWEAEDGELKLAIKEGLDLHLFNARDLFKLPYSYDDLKDPEILKVLKQRYTNQREFAKRFIHGTNYGGGAKTMGEACRVTTAEAAYLQAQWFERHPGIVKWHRRTEDQLMGRRYVENRFGYRRFYFDRIEGLLGEALAWLPQSTVACVINRGLVNIFENLKDVQLLNQVHDSLVGQFPIGREDLKQEIVKQMLIEVPYEEPLVIPVGIKTSQVSWGACS